MKADGVQRAVVFTQYPQYSCSTTGSSLNELHRGIVANNLETSIQWSIIDRWNTHPGFIDAMATKIERKLAEYTPEQRESAIILFSAHSLPMSVINRGDTYPAEVAASVDQVMKRLGQQYPYRLIWQSQVGPQPWLGPQTSDVVKNYGKAGMKNLVVVPIAFTSDHIETLFELDQEYGKEAEEVKKKHMARRGENSWWFGCVGRYYWVETSRSIERRPHLHERHGWYCKRTFEIESSRVSPILSSLPWMYVWQLWHNERLFQVLWPTTQAIVPFSLV